MPFVPSTYRRGLAWSSETNTVGETIDDVLTSCIVIELELGVQ